MNKGEYKTNEISQGQLQFNAQTAVTFLRLIINGRRF
jgi:hypothetical protein